MKKKIGMTHKITFKYGCWKKCFKLLVHGELFPHRQVEKQARYAKIHQVEVL